MSFPKFATEAMLAGSDSPSLRLLAGLDLEKFDPRDAGELFNSAITELGWKVPSLPEAMQIILGRLADQVEAGKLEPVEAATEFDAFLAALIDKVADTSGLAPSWILISRKTWLRYLQSIGTDGQYRVGGVSLANAKQAWGCCISLSKAVPDGNVIVGNPNACTRWTSTTGRPTYTIPPA